MFTMGNVNFDVLRGLPFYLLLGVISGIAAIGFTKLLYWVEDQFARLPINDLWHPAIGALGLGIIGFFVPRVLGVGYDTISDILNNNLALKLLILVAVFKALALVISLGSGTSGGLLAHVHVQRGDRRNFCDGGEHDFPERAFIAGGFALVAMAAVFGSASRATFAFIVFAFEITHDYNAILPLMLACVIADMIALRYLPSSIMTEKLTRRGLQVPNEFEVGAMTIVRVSEVMRKDVESHRAGDDRSGIGRAHGPRRTGLQSDPRIADRLARRQARRRSNARRFIARARAGPERNDDRTRSWIARSPIVAYPDELVHDAMHRMLQHNIGRLPVVSRENPQQMVGYFNRASLLGAWTRQMEEERIREHGWIRKWRNSSRRDKADTQATQKEA